MDDEDEEVEEGGGGMGTRMGEAEEDGVFCHARPGAAEAAVLRRFMLPALRAFGLPKIIAAWFTCYVGARAAGLVFTTPLAHWQRWPRRSWWWKLA